MRMVSAAINPEALPKRTTKNKHAAMIRLIFTSSSLQSINDLVVPASDGCQWERKLEWWVYENCKPGRIISCLLPSTPILPHSNSSSAYAASALRQSRSGGKPTFSETKQRSGV